ncbi:MAG TPA: DEAD/DEAH box helicase [Candidatus Dormibacteraeota bacterium]|nr:DEAD/DEAH box helicase [Candidatus Dormibacteraeota bacterium]
MTWQLRGFTLHAWQADAVDCWCRGADGRAFRGTLEVFTGGGKSLIALACAERVMRQAPATRVAIVVPTHALAWQWRNVVLANTDLDPQQVGLLGAGSLDTLSNRPVLVCVLNSAAKRLPEMASRAKPLLLVVDECHRAGAAEFSRVLQTRADFTLGLSATPARDEVDEDGDPIEYDEQLVGRAIGPVVYRFGLADAKAAGWLPDFRIEHHGVSLRKDELARYQQISRRIDDLSSDLEAFGGDPWTARRWSARNDAAGKAARAYTAAVGRRKDLLYRAHERGRVAERLVAMEAKAGSRRMLLFHERVTEAEALFKRLAARRSGSVAIEHSGLPDSIRKQALAGFASGEIKILVSVRSLIEGIDVPEADVGISVASSSSVRQRIQSLGRVLRRASDPNTVKSARMHVLYVRETVDEAIYGKENWNDLTGAEANVYFAWPLDTAEAPMRMAQPPQVPPATEDEEWQRLERRPPTAPQEWKGEVPIREYAIDTTGTVTTVAGSVITNWGAVAELLRSLHGTPAGRFRVTPTYRLVIAFQQGTAYVIGQLHEPPRLLAAENTECPDVRTASPGSVYSGPTDKANGTFRLALKMGGVIERTVRRGAQFALTDTDSDSPEIANANAVLSAWRQAIDRGIDFHVNTCWHAWYLLGGQPHFLSEVPGGFRWPSPRGGNE